MRGRGRMGSKDWKDLRKGRAAKTKDARKKSARKKSTNR